MKQRLVLLFILIISICYQGKAQESFISSYNKADSIFRLVEEKYKYDLRPSYKRTYSGKEYLRGHFYKPNGSEIYDVDCIYELKDRVYTISSTINYKEKLYSAQYKFEGDSCVYNEYGDTSVTQKGYDSTFEYLSDPINILYTIYENKVSLHIIDTLNSKYFILGFNDKQAIKFYLYINSQTLLIEKVYKPFYDNNYGNSYEEMVFGDYTSNVPYIPQKIRYSVANNIKKDLVLTNIESVDLSNSTIQNDRNQYSFLLDTISTNVYLIKVSGLENKVLILKDKEYISVFEAPVNPILSSELIRFLNNKFNGLDIKNLFLTHHHPDHAAGIKAFADIGCNIIAPKLHIQYLDSLAHIDYSFNNYYNVYNKKPIYQFVEKEAKAVAFENKNVIAYEIGEKTGHSEYFIVYYLPHSNIIFISDLVFFSAKEIKPHGKRAYSLYELIKNEKIKTKNLKLIPSFLITNHKDVGTYTDLIDCLKKNYPDVK